jgi:hypothetical protein
MNNIKEKCKIFNGWWKRGDCTKHSNALFVFGDNVERVGNGGQATIRGKKNSIGICTKNTPSSDRGAYFSDDNYEENIEVIIQDIDNIIYLSYKYDTIFFPEDGLGTGLAKLDKKAPKTFKKMNELIKEKCGIDYEELLNDSSDDDTSQESFYDNDSSSTYTDKSSSDDGSDNSGNFDNSDDNDNDDDDDGDDTRSEYYYNCVEQENFFDELEYLRSNQ